MAKTTGGCLCGYIRYEINGEPFRIANCHCDDCRKATGAAYATNLFYREDQLTILEGKTKTFEHSADSGNSMKKEFCDKCGSQVFGSGTLRPGVKSVKVGTIDDASFVEPEVNLYVARSLKCVILDQTIDNFDSMPPSS